MKYREEKNISEQYKQKYLLGIEELIYKLEKQAVKKRNDICRDIITDREKYIRVFSELLGWPLMKFPKEEDLNVIREVVSEELSCIIERVQLTVIDGIVMTGLLFRYPEEKLRPFVIVQHGAQGTPELISGMYGNTYNYNDIVDRFFQKGANVFAPQLLLWSNAEYKSNYDREMLDARLKNVGSSITALEIYSIMRSLDYFEKQDWVGNIGMAGLSYGGFYTLFTAALDVRVKAAISCSYFCDAMHYVTPDWSWREISKYLGEAEIACLVYPRKLFLEMGRYDELFDYRKSRAEYERVLHILEDNNNDWLEFMVFDGNHEFYQNDDHIEKMIAYLKEEA